MILSSFGLISIKWVVSEQIGYASNLRLTIVSKSMQATFLLLLLHHQLASIIFQEIVHSSPTQSKLTTASSSSSFYLFSSEQFLLILDSNPESCSISCSLFVIVSMNCNSYCFRLASSETSNVLAITAMKIFRIIILDNINHPIKKLIQMIER